MNLWANRLRQLLIPAVALFFSSCEEEISYIGFKNPNDKFDNYTIDIPLASTVMRLDSIRTSNNNGFVQETNRLLVGRYNDPQLGTISSTAIASYFWSSAAKLPANAQLLSAELHLAFDLYFYGSETASEQTFTVHELSGALTGINRSKYVNKTTVEISDNPIGSLTRTINPPLIREQYTQQPTPQYDTLKIPLSESFYSRIWDAARKWSYDGDSTLSYYKPQNFLQEFKGIAIKPGESNNMMVGFSADFQSFSRIVLRYQAGDTKGLLTLILDPGLISYNNIVPDYAAGPLAGIPFHADFEPGNNLRYMQAGTGVVTKLLLDNFMTFADTVGPNIIINDIQLLVEGVQANDAAIPPPSAFVLRALGADNMVRRIPELSKPGSADSLLYRAFRLPLPTQVPLIYLDLAAAQRPALINHDYGVVMANDVGNQALFTYNATEKRYSAPSGTSVALFFQQLYRLRADPQLTRFIMFPMTSGTGPSGLKSVNRAIFPADQIKLRVRYTKPIFEE